MNNTFTNYPQNPSQTLFKTYFSPSKFKPPALSSEKILERRLLIESYTFLSGSNKRLMVIEAPAGFGKTIFAQQCVSNSAHLSGWCQIQPEDRDGVEFLGVLITLLSGTLPAFHSQRVEQALAEGAVHHNELIHYGKLLAEEIQITSPVDYVLVVDDLHLIEDAEASTSLLATLINNTPSWFKWLVVSRRPVEMAFPCESPKVPMLKVGPQSLSFSPDETSDLLINTYKLPFTQAQIKRIHKVTEGWAYGLSLIAYKCRRNIQQITAGACLANSITSLEDFKTYFSTELFHEFSEEQADSLLRIGLLDELPLSFLQNLLGNTKANQLITFLENGNYFLRCLDEQQRIYGFHHLFRESLVKIASSRLSPDTIRDIYSKAASYHLLKGEIIKALQYAARADDYLLCDEILKSYGLDLYGVNQITAILEVLGTITEPQIMRNPWISLFYGMCLQDATPMKALRFYDNAHQLFRREEDELGLLLTLNQLVEFHVIIDCQFQKLGNLLPTIEILSERLAPRLPLLFQIRSSYMLAFGYCFLQSDMAKVDLYTSKSLKLCQNGSFDNQLAMIHLIRGYQYAFVGDWEGVNEQIEISRPMLRNPRVASLSKHFLQMMQINTLEMMGDFTNYRAQKQILEQAAQQNIVLQSIIAPFIAIWDIDSAIAEDRIEDALKFTEQGLKSGFAAAMPHMRSQFLHYKALIAGIQGDEDAVGKAARESLELRKEVGGKAFIILNHQIIGAAYAQLGSNLAFKHFRTAQKLSDELGEKFQWVSIHAHRAALHLRNHDRSAARDDVRNCLTFLKRKQYVHFFSWTPRVMRPVLEAALQNDIEIDYARGLLKNRLMLGVDYKNNIIPLLRINVLGQFSFSFGEDQQLVIDRFTPHQRKLLTLLLSSLNRYLPEEQAEYTLWPDKPPKKQRSSLHNLISRLRKMIEELSGQSVMGTDYLTNDKGIIRLHNSRIDCYEFQENIQLGLKLAKEKKSWQAANHFHRAFTLCTGQCMTASGIDRVDEYRDELEMLYIEGAKCYCDILGKHDQSTKTTAILEQAFRFNPLDHQTARKCYDLHAVSGNHKAAANILERFTSAHRMIDDNPETVKEVLEKFWG